MKKSFLIVFVVLIALQARSQSQVNKTDSTRELWLTYLDKVARPVMENIALDKLKANMPMLLSDRIDNKESRNKAGYLEAFGRTLSGIAPWIETECGSEREVKLRNQYREWALKGIANAVNPSAKDYLEWHGGQALVDASFVALGLIRSPWLWAHLDKKVQSQVVDALIITRKTIPSFSNWILFSGMIEAFFCKYDLDYNPLTIEYSIREFTAHWYVGDGLYSDGMNFHLDYYNSIVIQPNLGTILDIMNTRGNRYQQEAGNVKKISQRYAEILERLINIDGSYPVLGRSIVYRGGVFHHLAYMAYTKQLPSSLTKGQVREALTAVIKKTLSAPGTFTKDGWLNIGLAGNQPGLADFYITTGSLYICENIFIPLGLPATDDFWTSAPEPWTAVKVWSGKDVPADHAMDMGNH